MNEQMRQGAIVAIGGGNIRTGEMRRIDERVVELTGVAAPRVLFIPTASADRPDYIEAFRRIYGRDQLIDDRLHFPGAGYPNKLCS